MLDVAEVRRISEPGFLRETSYSRLTLDRKGGYGESSVHRTVTGTQMKCTGAAVLRARLRVRVVTLR